MVHNQLFKISKLSNVVKIETQTQSLLKNFTANAIVQLLRLLLQLSGSRVVCSGALVQLDPIAL